MKKTYRAIWKSTQMHISPLISDKMCSRVVYFFLNVTCMPPSGGWWESGWVGGATEPPLLKVTFCLSAADGHTLVLRRAAVSPAAFLAVPAHCHRCVITLTVHCPHSRFRSLPHAANVVCYGPVWPSPQDKKNIDPLSCLNIQLSKNGNNIYLV